ncbi:hypothetical protein Fcan01_25004 [Folsomia candida]|uniref:Uncharacterized protein n=1 Tax=Folsomia candida TaxID=158441 RepID=A0A226D6A7_FOLCA|nr:hypothetical protein Fcan01_25004 [Folsomia candida]
MYPFSGRLAVFLQIVVISMAATITPDPMGSASSLQNVTNQQIDIESSTNPTSGLTDIADETSPPNESDPVSTTKIPPVDSSPLPIEITPQNSTTVTTTTTTTSVKPAVDDAKIDRINTGVSTILKGVMSLDLAKILRGAFIFPKNEKVKSVANHVIDTIFGPEPTPGGNSSAQHT